MTPVKILCHNQEAVWLWLITGTNIVTAAQTEMFQIKVTFTFTFILIPWNNTLKLREGQTLPNPQFTATLRAKGNASLKPPK